MPGSVQFFPLDSGVLVDPADVLVEEEEDVDWSPLVETEACLSDLSLSPTSPVPPADLLEPVNANVVAGLLDFAAKSGAKPPPPPPPPGAPKSGALVQPTPLAGVPVPAAPLSSGALPGALPAPPPKPLPQPPTPPTQHGLGR